jgi:Flp pilus assembly protein protease CpaA
MTIPELQLLISLIPLAYVGGAMIPIFHSDYTRNKVSNKIVVPLMVLTLLCWLTLAIWQGEWLKFGISILFFIGTILFGFFINIKYDLLGMGDVKLLATLSMILAWFSWGVALVFLPVTAVLSLVIGFFVVMLSTAKDMRLSPVVFITFGFLVAVAMN